MIPARAPARAELAQEVRDEVADVLAALAQRRHSDLDHAQPVVEVGAEASGGDLGREVAIGGRDHAHVDGAGLVRADPLDDAVLEHAQQLGLERQRGVADLVEEQRAAVRELELARPLGDRAGEGAAHVAEQLALEQLQREPPRG